MSEGIGTAALNFALCYRFGFLFNIGIKHPASATLCFILSCGAFFD